MENEKNEMKKKPGKVLPWLAAVLLAAALAARAAVPVPAGLVTQIWNIGTQLIILFSGLVLFSAAARAVFQRVSPSSNHGKTVFTLADSAIRYLLIIVGLLWALSIVGVDVRALLAGAGVLALIIGFGAESLIADVITGTFMLFEHQYEVGDIIVVGDFRGTVTQIGIRTTQIMDSGGNVKIINNSDIRSLINRSNDLSFAVCDMAVPYDKESLARAEKVLGEVLPKLHREHPDLFSKAPAYLGVQSLDYENRAVVLRVAGETHEEDAPLPDIRLTEIVPHSTQINADGYAMGSITLTSFADAPADLTGWGLADRVYKVKYVFERGTTLAPGESLTVYLAGKHGAKGTLRYASFGLSAKHEEHVYLYAADGRTSDEIALPALGTDGAYRRVDGEWEAVVPAVTELPADAI